ncbi:MAG TPA: glycosyl hydrolase, partial [Thermoanaerobaculia bacterium]
ITTPLGPPQTFEAVPLSLASMPAKDQAAQLDFERKTARLQRAVRGAAQAVDEAQEHLKFIQKAILDTPKADVKLLERARQIDLHLQDIEVKLSGDPTLTSHNEPTPPAILDRVDNIVQGHWSTSSEATQTYRDDYAVAAAEFAPVLEDVRKTIEVDLKGLETQLEAAGAPWTPGRVPNWKPE